MSAIMTTTDEFKLPSTTKWLFRTPTNVLQSHSQLGKFWFQTDSLVVPNQEDFEAPDKKQMKVVLINMINIRKKGHKQLKKQ